MNTTKIILDRLAASLEANGVRLKRSQLLEATSMAWGYHNSNEFSAAVKRGDLDPPAALPLGRIMFGDGALIVLRDPSSGAPYAIDESFLEGPVENERRERFGPTPYGGLVDLGNVADHPATVWNEPGVHPRGPRHDVDAPRYMAYDPQDLRVLVETDDLEVAREACHLDDGRMDLESYIVDRRERTISRARCCWRIESLPVVDAGADVAAELFMARVERDETKESHATTLRIDVPDWRTWEKSLKKASHKQQEPISDEILHQFRHAIADVTSKSSSSEKSQVVYRQTRYVEKHLGGLIARLDRAEEALREAGLAPAEIARKSKDDAAETLAAIEAVTTRRKDLTMHNLYEVEATRDGDKCREVFAVLDGQDPDDLGRRITAKAFRMDLEDYRHRDLEELDKSGNPIPDYSGFDSECDTFEVSPVMMPEAAAIIGDALSELSAGGDFRYGIPHDHPARIKLVAARRMIEPRPTVVTPAA